MRRLCFAMVALIALAVVGMALPAPVAASPACTIVGTDGLIVWLAPQATM